MPGRRRTSLMTYVSGPTIKLLIPSELRMLTCRWQQSSPNAVMSWITPVMELDSWKA